jgi:4-hydroxy-tetrahydrodipicolinate synthase
MGPHLFTGVGVALVTLFRPDGSVDLEATTTHASRLVGSGVQALVVAGSTGEAAALDREERRELIAAIREVATSVPVLAGTGAASARQATVLTADARAAGAAAALVLSPLRSSDPRRYYREVVTAAEGMPVLAYHFPSMSPPGLDVEVLPELGVTGVKDSSGDPDRLLRTLDLFDGAVYLGSAALLVQGGALGCHGAMLALANVAPEDCVAAFAGDGAAQRRLTALHLAAKRDFPHGIKRLVADRFGTPVDARMG